MQRLGDSAAFLSAGGYQEMYTRRLDLESLLGEPQVDLTLPVGPPDL